MTRMIAVTAIVSGSTTRQFAYAESGRLIGSLTRSTRSVSTFIVRSLCRQRVTNIAHEGGHVFPGSSAALLQQFIKQVQARRPRVVVQHSRTSEATHALCPH